MFGVVPSSTMMFARWPIVTEENTRVRAPPSRARGCPRVSGAVYRAALRAGIALLVVEARHLAGRKVWILGYAKRPLDGVRMDIDVGKARYSRADRGQIPQTLQARQRVIETDVNVVAHRREADETLEVAQHLVALDHQVLNRVDLLEPA